MVAVVINDIERTQPNNNTPSPGVAPRGCPPDWAFPRLVVLMLFGSSEESKEAKREPGLLTTEDPPPDQKKEFS